MTAISTIVMMQPAIKPLDENASFFAPDLALLSGCSGVGVDADLDGTSLDGFDELFSSDVGWFDVALPPGRSPSPSSLVDVGWAGSDVAALGVLPVVPAATGVVGVAALGVLPVVPAATGVVGVALLVVTIRVASLVIGEVVCVVIVVVAVVVDVVVVLVVVVLVVLVLVVLDLVVALVLELVDVEVEVVGHTPCATQRVSSLPSVAAS